MWGSAPARAYVQPGARSRVSPWCAVPMAAFSACGSHGTEDVFWAWAASAAGTDPRQSATTPPATVTAALVILKYINSPP